MLLSFNNLMPCRTKLKYVLLLTTHTHRLTETHCLLNIITIPILLIITVIYPLFVEYGWLKSKIISKFAAPDSAGKLHVGGHQGDSLGVVGAQVGVLKQVDYCCLAGFLQSG